MAKPKLICIVGPTASGKTEWGIKLAKKFDGEIISADSRQIYKGMDIGTGKPRTKASGTVRSKAPNDQEQYKLVQNIPHYMINILEPDEKFSAADFKSKAVKIIRQIHKKNKTPFLVGGTGLYVKSVTKNYQFPEQGSTEKREKLKERPLKELQKKLKETDPRTAQEIELKNKQRVVRALEVAQSTDKSFLKQKKKGPRLFDSLQIGIKLPRKKLYQKIDKRVEKMLKAGLEKEVRELVERYGWNQVLKNTIGYKEWQGYFEEQSSKKETIELIKKNTRNYAKRQLTWFQNKCELNWVKDLKKAEKLVDNFLKR